MVEAAEKYKSKINDSVALHGADLLFFLKLRMRLQLLVLLQIILRVQLSQLPHRQQTFMLLSSPS